MSKHYLERWNCDKIFAASVCGDSIKKYGERLLGKVVYLQRERKTIAESIEEIDSRNKFIDKSFVRDDREYRDKVRKVTKEYPQEMILFKCTYLIGAKSGQTIATFSLNSDRYKDI